MKRRATAPDKRRHRPARISLLAMRVCLSGCMMPVALHASSEPPAAFASSRHELVVDVAERLTVLTGFLTGRPVADVAAVHLDGDGDRRLRVLSLSMATGQRQPKPRCVPRCPSSTLPESMAGTG